MDFIAIINLGIVRCNNIETRNVLNMIHSKPPSSITLCVFEDVIFIPAMNTAGILEQYINLNTNFSPKACNEYSVRKIPSK